MSTFDPDNVPRFDFAYLRVAGDIHAKYVLAEDYDNLLRLYRRMESTKEVPMEMMTDQEVTEFTQAKLDIVHLLGDDEP